VVARKVAEKVKLREESERMKNAVQIEDIMPETNAGAVTL
jgi:hypothetical protein